MHVETSLELHKPTKDTINPAYCDDSYKHSVGKLIGYYEEVNIPPEVKITPNPAYRVP